MPKARVGGPFCIGVAFLAALVVPDYSIGSSAGVEVEADRILQQACEGLKGAGRFSFHADITFDEVLETGQKLQYAGSLDTAVRRPDRIRSEYRGDLDYSAIWYDGRTLTLLDERENLYATAPAPDEIDSLLDHTVEKLGFAIPAADLFYSDPYAGLRRNVISGSYAGIDSVAGVPCHHLTFEQKDIDWQIWVSEEEPSVPKKFTITYKNLPGSPQYTATFSNWNFSPQLPDAHFIFVPAPDADGIDFLPSEDGSLKEAEKP